MKTERELARSLRALVDGQELPPSPWRKSIPSSCRAASAEPAVPWPVDCRIEPNPQVLGVAAALALASSLALTQAADGGQRIDAAAGRYFAQERVQAGLRQAIESLAAPPNFTENNGGVHTPGSNTGPQPEGGGGASA